MTRVYVGRLSHRASDRDIEYFFRGYGKLADIIMKNGFGFVEFEDSRDAEDAVHDLNGKDLCGERVILEFPRRKLGYNEDRGAGGDRDRGRGRDSFKRNDSRQFSSRYGRPCSTRFRLVIENLSTRYSWQDIKDHIRRIGIEPTYSEAHKKNLNEALVCFSTADDLRRAMEKLNGDELNGRKLKCIDDTQPDRSRSRSRSRDRKRSPSSSRSRSRSPPPRRSRSRSRSPVKRNEKRGRSSRSRSSDRNSRSPSPRNGNDRARSASRSPSPKKRRATSGSRTPSPSR